MEGVGFGMHCLYQCVGCGLAGGVRDGDGVGLGMLCVCLGGGIGCRCMG